MLNHWYSQQLNVYPFQLWYANHNHLGYHLVRLQGHVHSHYQSQSLSSTKQDGGLGYIPTRRQCTLTLYSSNIFYAGTYATDEPKYDPRVKICQKKLFFLSPTQLSNIASFMRYWASGSESLRWSGFLKHPRRMPYIRSIDNSAYYFDILQ